MASQPLEFPRQDDLPDYLPARMVNEFVYCPRLFFYEWVEGVFRESADTVEGSVQHQRVDKEGGELPPADRVQIVLQAMILREGGYRCEEGIVYYRATNQRIRVPITDDLVQEAEAAVANAWKTARQRII